MKNSRSSSRPFTQARFLTTVVIAVGLVAAFVVTAFVRDHARPSESAAASAPVKRPQVLRRSIFADGYDKRGKDAKTTGVEQAGEVADSDQADDNPLTQSAPQDGASLSSELPKVLPAVFDGDVRRLPVVPQLDRQEREMDEPTSKAKELLAQALGPQMADPNIPFAPMPGPNQNFAGLSRNDACTGGPCGNGTPPDTNGDVGPNHYIQSVNSSFGIYNKTGTLLASFTENSLFSGGPTGTICDTNSGGDPVVIYDSLADRWILTNLAYTGNATVGPFFECMAVSKTGDPVAGGWYLYAVRTDTGLAGQPPVNIFPDYPKFGTWTDCLYYSANGFNSAGSFTGGLFASFSRLDMYSGNALTASLGYSASGSDFFAMLPSNLSAPASGLPPAGRLNYYVQESLTAFNFRVRTFTPGTNCGGVGVLSAVTTVSQTAYTTAGTDVTQPNTANLLDSLSDRMMQKNQYRNVGGTESLWVTHTTRTAPVDQPQWAQINVTGGPIAAAPVQQQIYAPDATINRWMPSIAADKDGNVAVAYSTSNGTAPNFPSIAYSGRLVGDAANQLPQTETQLVAGLGSQTGTCGGSPCARWGDYTAISVDPSDSCTFWITNEYFVSQANGSANSPIWNTRIGSFVFPGCVPAASTPTVPAAPTNLTFTGVTQFSETLNWNDIAVNEDGYVIYRSTDNVNFSFAAITAANATSQAVGGLTPSTNYFWKVYAFTKGALSTQLTGSQATLPPGNISCTGAGGNWSSTATWAGGVLPSAGDNVTIVPGCTVTIDTAALSFAVTINNGGVLQYETTTARTLTTSGDVTIDSGGVFQTGGAGPVTTHSLSVNGSLTNNGTLDFSTAANLAAAGITFTGAGNNTFGGTGGTTDIRTLTINKGTSFANTLELNPTNFTVQGVNVGVLNFLTLTNGTLKVSGTFSFSSTVFTPAGYTIGATAGFWLNNPNFTVVGQNGSPTESGLLRITQGTFNIGTSSGNSMGFSTGSTIIVEGGAVNATGRFGVAAAANAITYTQSGSPTITVCTVGNASATLGSFDLGTSLSSIITISGGTVVVQISATAIDYRDQAGSGIAGVTGGTLQLGNAASGAAKAFVLKGVVPNLVITNTSANHTASWTTGPVNYNNISLNITVNTGNTLNFGNVTFLFDGTVLTNNGTLTHNGASSSFVVFNAAAPVSYTGAGTVTVPMTSFALQSDQGFTINPASANIPTLAVRLFTGNIINANKFTIGNAAATSAVIQIGNTTTPTAAGTFDTTPVFNPGTAGTIFSYLRTTLARSTGPEVPGSRTLTTFSYDDNDVTHSLTIAGGDLTVTGTTTLTNGRVITGANTFIIGSAGTITRTNGYIDGNLRKTYTAAGSKSYELGTANGFSPLTVNATAGTFPVTFDAKAVQGAQPNMALPTLALSRYWTLSSPGPITADLTFNYLDPTDIPGTATEANFKIIKYNGTFTAPGGSVNTVANTATITGVSSFSDWTLAEPTAPTSADGGVTGTITDAGGAPLGGVTINLSGTQSGVTITDNSGKYHFDNVETNGFYTVTPSRANYTFTPENRSFSLLGVHTEASFTATANNGKANPLDTNEFFVRQQYLDFLNREPDAPGLAGWVSTLNNCAAGDTSCDRVHVSEAFYRSQEFQERGYFAYRFYTTALGRKPDYAEFAPDLARVSGFLDNAQLEAAKTALVDNFMSKPEFARQYDSLSDTAFVDKLLQTAGVTSADRQSLIDGLRTGRLRRAGVLRQIAESSAVYQKYYNQAFVVMEYFGYLHRDPDALYLNWIVVLDANPTDSRRMVDGFVNSAEYRSRFVP